MKTTKALRKKLDNWKQKPIVAQGQRSLLYMGGAALILLSGGVAGLLGLFGGEANLVAEREQDREKDH